MISEFKPFFQLKSSEQRYQYALLRIFQQYRPSHCFVAKFIDHGQKVKVLCHLHDGHIADNFIYDLNSTPCEQAKISTQLYCIAQGAQAQYPDDPALRNWQIEGYLATTLMLHDAHPIGILVCMFDQPIDQSKHNFNRFNELGYVIGGELNHQHDFSSQQKLLDQLAAGERLAKRGSMHFTPGSGEIICSDEIFNILHLERSTKVSLTLLLKMIHSADRNKVRNGIESLLKDKSSTLDISFRAKVNGQQKFLIMHSDFVFDGDSQVSSLHISLADISQTYELNEQLRLSNFVFEHTAEAIMITDKNNRIVAVNKALERTTGYRKKELLGKDPIVFSAGKQDAHFYRQMWKDMVSAGHWKGEVFNRHKNGDVFPEELSLNIVKNEQGETINYVGIFRDISERKATEKQLSFYANNEPLTGLSNRRAFIERIEHHIFVSKRHNAPFSLLFFNIDRFKEINDVHSHETGDLLLQAVASRILKNVRKEDIVCRYGGDEFTILLVNTPQDKAAIAAEKFLAQMRTTFLLKEISLDVTTSIGIAQYPDSGLNAAELLRNANHAMTSIKNDGRDGIAFYNDKLQSKYLKKLSLRSQLKEAIANQSFEVYYQPIVDLYKNEINKFEALIRWPVPGGGFISPGEFIPIAEEFGLIHPIGNFVLQRACADLKKLHNRGFDQVVFSINRSISEFGHDVDGAAIISQTIVANGLPYEAIVIEVTESVAMSSNEHTEQVLAKLKEYGIRIALDDFCTGYSSLSNLIEYKSDFLKIDKSFIDAICTDKNHQILICALIDLATKLEMQVIAEGVEDKAQLELLREYGCQYIQGYYYSPARPLKQCIKLLEDWPQI